MGLVQAGRGQHVVMVGCSGPEAFPKRQELGEEAEGKGRAGGGALGWQIRPELGFATSRGCQTSIPQPSRPLARSSPSRSIWRGHPPSAQLCS